MDGRTYITLTEAFLRTLDLGSDSLSSEATDLATKRRRALFRRGISLCPTSTWLQRLAEAESMDGSTLRVPDAVAV